VTPDSNNSKSKSQQQQQQQQQQRQHISLLSPSIRVESIDEDDDDEQPTFSKQPITTSSFASLSSVPIKSLSTPASSIAHSQVPPPPSSSSNIQPPPGTPQKLSKQNQSLPSSGSLMHSPTKKFRSSSDIHSRLSKAQTEAMTIVRVVENGEFSSSFHVRTPSANTYHIELAAKPSCTCPDHSKHSNRSVSRVMRV
jgi:hypothetical protein